MAAQRFRTRKGIYLCLEGRWYIPGSSAQLERCPVPALNKCTISTHFV